MTGTTISDVKVKNMLWGNVGNLGKAQNVQGQECFSAVFDKAQNPAQENQENASVKTEETENIQEHNELRETKTSRQLKEQGEKVKGVKHDKMEEAGDKMVEEVAETFGISIKEVETVLENLGLTAVDLLNVENLTQLVLALNPECDALSLMTDEALFADLKGLMNLAQELKNQLMQEFNLTEDEIMAELETVSETEVVSKEDYGKNDAEIIETVNESIVLSETESSREVRSSLDEAGDNSGNAFTQQFAQDFVNQLAEAVENTNDTTAMYGVSGREIINQITEQIRIHVKQDTTEMELQLHPASLGNVKVQLTSAGGVLTAIFTTENEAVKAVLESQLIQLKENFTEQGLKVESVEVNVSAQGFERSLDQQEQEQNRFEDNRNKKANRRIRLNGIENAEELMSEDMTEDDRIVADMMIRNGNTVDYTI